MLELAKICEALLPIAYCMAAGIYALAFFRKGEGFERWTRLGLVAVVVIHTVLIYARTVYHGHCLVYSPFELMTMISYTVTLTYLVVEIATGERSTGLFFLGFALLLQTVSAMFAPGVEVAAADPLLLHNIVGAHISAALIGYTAFSISAVYGGLYLMLYHQIRKSRFGTFYNRLPSLELLERMSEKSALVGLVFLTVSIVIAVVWLPDVLPMFHYDDPKLIATAVTWVVYLTALLSKYIARIDGRRVIVLSLVGFLGTILSMTVINILLSGFHRFG
jgi:ABC-type uncharacterized transport system permease subunit